MVAKEISSLKHPLVQRALQLRTDADLRKQEKRVLVAGRKYIQDLATFWPIETFFFQDSEPDINAPEKIKTSLAVLKKITGLENPDGWAAVVPLPPTQSLQNTDRILVLDRLGDPGNVGTLWRTALALGWDGIWMTPGTVDPFNDKALRASQGASFRLPYEWMTQEAILSWTKERTASLYIADVLGVALNQCQIKTPLALVLSHEGQGPSGWNLDSSQFITIPISPLVQSLNVASAGAILLYSLRPSR